MNVWLLKDGEPLPTRPEIKQLRTAMLAQALTGRGHRVRWFCSTMSHVHKQTEATPGNYEVGGYHVTRIEAGLYRRNLSLGRILHHRRLACAWRKMVAQMDEQPDIIVASYPIPEWVSAAYDYAKARGIPLVVDVRDQWPDSFKAYLPCALSPLVRLATRLLYPRVARDLRAATAVTSMSHPVLAWALQKAKRPCGPDTPVFYLGTSLPLADMPRPPRQWDASRPFRCLFLGTLGHTSDIMSVVAAAKQLHAPHPHITFTIAGDGDYRSALAGATASLPNVQLVGWCHKDGVLDQLAQADMALLLGHNEAMPNKFFDYVAARLPIVCSLRGEVRSTIERDQLGVTCPSGDGAALAQAVLDVAASYDRYAANVAAWPPARFHSDAIYSEFAAFLEQYAAPRC